MREEARPQTRTPARRGPRWAVRRFVKEAQAILQPVWSTGRKDLPELTTST